MDQWLPVLSLFLANAGLIIWFRTESRAVWKHSDQNLNQMREEVKDFHWRLCTLEKRFLNWLTRNK